MLTPDDFSVEVKKLHYLYANLFTSLIGIFGLSVVVVISLFDVIEHDKLFLWFSLHTFVLLLRVLLLVFYKKNTIVEINYSYYYKFFFITALMHSLLWGYIPFFMFPQQIEYQMMLMFLVAGITAATAVSLSPKMIIFTSYILSALLPFTLYYFINTSEVSLIFSITLLFYILILLKMAKQSSSNIHSNILLDLKNRSLISQLEEKIVAADTANKAKSEFLSVMSHEIRTPLNAIIGFVQILNKLEKDEKKKNYLSTIDNSSKILMNVINDILDISKIESGKFTLEMIQFSPKDEFTSVYTLFKQNAHEKGVKLINSISEDLPQTIVSDVLRLKQIISNLLSNAVKFTPSNKEIELSISYDRANSLLNIQVRDEGIGISQENIQTITEAFKQADSSTARKYGGTGLGLSIVSRLLELFNSKLMIKSTLHKGSTFSFSIKAESMQDAIPDAMSINEDATYPDKRILVAEDNKTNQILIKMLLEDVEIEVKIANDGLEAESMFQKESFDIVLMDINMPNKNGIEAMHAIKEFEIQNRGTTTPIIALTANAVHGDREKYIEEGFDEYLSKPINTQELLKVLEHHL